MTESFAFPDAMAEVASILRDVLTDSENDEAEGATVGTSIPWTRGNGAPELPYVLVRHDGARIQQRVVENVTIRVAVYHRTEYLGHALAQLCRRILVEHSGGAVRGIRPLTGPFMTSDPDSGSPLSFFTISVRTRPI